MGALMNVCILIIVALIGERDLLAYLRLARSL